MKTKTRGEIKSLCCRANLYQKSDYIQAFCERCNSNCGYEEVFSSKMKVHIDWSFIFFVASCLVSVSFGIVWGVYMFQAENEINYTFENYQHKTTQAKVFELLNEQLTVREADKMMAVAYNESRFNQYATNANKNGSVDRGVFQFNSKAHKEISDECSFNLVCATNQAIRIYKSRGAREWSCNKFLKF